MLLSLLLQLYVFENNIYYQANSRSFSWRLTSSGQEAAIFNGIADWLYEGRAADWLRLQPTRLTWLAEPLAAEIGKLVAPELFLLMHIKVNVLLLKLWTFLQEGFQSLL